MAAAVNVLLATGNADLRVAVELVLREEPNLRLEGAVSDLVGLDVLYQTCQTDIVIIDWRLCLQRLPSMLDGGSIAELPVKILAICWRDSERESASAAGVGVIVSPARRPEALRDELRQACSGHN